MVTGFFSEQEIASRVWCEACLARASCCQCDNDGCSHCGLKQAGRLEAAIGMELPLEMLEKVDELREWAKENGPKAECALFCAFHPPVAALDERARRIPGLGFNPTGVDDIDIGRARRTLIALRDAFLMPTIWDAEMTVLFSHTIMALHDILTTYTVTGLETDGAGEETG
jgi:hypothetical protein